jgi:uncharacterized protein (DUF885 family)
MKASLVTCVLFPFMIISGCQTNPNSQTIFSGSNDPEQSDQPAVQRKSPNNEEQRLTQLIEQYAKESYEFNPFGATFQGLPGYNDQFSPAISEQNSRKRDAFERKYLSMIRTTNTTKLTSQHLITYKMFERQRLMAIEASLFPFERLPINQMSGMHNFFAQLGSGESAQPFNSEQDYRDFIERSKGFAQWMDSAVVSMRKGIAEGVVLPKPIVDKILPQLEIHFVRDIKASVFYQPLNNLPKDLSHKAKQQLIADYETNITSVIIPSYRKVHSFLAEEYSQFARRSFGLSALPNGKKWYEFMIKTHTTLPLNAQEIHQFGLDEVSRILNEMERVRAEVQFDGELPQFFEFLRSDPQFYFEKPEQLVNAYQQVKMKIDATLPKLFEVFPKADYVVKPVPSFQAKSSAGAYYSSPAPDGSRPGVFFINTYNMKSQPKFLMETLSIHEAAPGHHFQIAIQQEIEGLPNFRKYGGLTVFNEGWALYAESLGRELGLFTDPYMWYGRLVDEQLRAMRLVVDTGLHAFGWSRDQAIDYMMANSSMARSDVEAEVERYIVTPGQAVAYKIGQRKIRQLRELGEKRLGKKFDIKKFHTQILLDGSLPMPLLEEKIKKWIERQS